MAVDTASARVCPNHGSLKTEVDSIKTKLNELEPRVRDIETTYIDDDKHQLVLDKLETIQISNAKYMAYVTIIFSLIVFIFQYYFKNG